MAYQKYSSIIQNTSFNTRETLFQSFLVFPQKYSLVLKIYAIEKHHYKLIYLIYLQENEDQQNMQLKVLIFKQQNSFQLQNAMYSIIFIIIINILNFLLKIFRLIMEINFKIFNNILQHHFLVETIIHSFTLLSIRSCSSNLDAIFRDRDIFYQDQFQAIQNLNSDR
ncbi:unnamed protein product [Paramecium sonneborni]|uniref:Transmembrane protein n=1 Tax=Paramecium sonneborni TaxID=65129 RepID=A0A8S1QMZ3_9CILI|nr:unnamed protein product [Paramecium sonneborni]